MRAKQCNLYFITSVLTRKLEVIRATNCFNLCRNNVASLGVMLHVLLPALATCCATNSASQVAGKCCEEQKWLLLVAMSCGNLQHGKVLLNKSHEWVVIRATLCSTCNVILLRHKLKQFVARFTSHRYSRPNDVIDISPNATNFLCLKCTLFTI